MTALASKYPNRRWLVWIAIAVAVFYWRILFTSQFSIVEDWEAVNQGFAWHQFGAREVQSGVLPLWDPYTFSGRSHIGEMQPGLFYPPKLLLYLWPFDERDMLSVRFYNQYFALARLLGAFFMFWFALEAGIVNRFAAMIAGIGFALGGYVGSVGGSQLWDSAIWLPLVCLFLLRALRADRPGWPLLYSALAGLSLAMMLLAGGLHSAMMATIVVVTAAAYLTWEKRKGPGEFPAARELVRSSAIVLGIGVVTFAAAAIQLLPTIEYAPTVLRWGSGGTGVEKIRYEVLTHAHYQPPHALFGLLFGGADISPAEVSPYFGVLPLLLVILGVWRFWSVPLVKYAAGLAVLALVYSMGPYSLLHGVLYLVPYLDAAREPGRFIYLTHFGMALLAGFGAQALLDSDASFQPKLHRFARFFGFGVMALVLVLLVPSLYGTPAVSEWHFFSLLIFVSTYATLRYVLQPHSAAAGRLLVVAVILWDLYAFNWVIHNRMAAEKSGSDHFAQALAARPAADFFHSQPGPFRVQVEGQRPAYINMGDMFAVQTTAGQAATTSIDYMEVWAKSRHGACLTNIRYQMLPDQDREGRLVFRSGRWRVYEQPDPCPRGWVVHDVIVEPSEVRMRQLMEEPQFDPLRSAFVAAPLETSLEAAAESSATVRYTHYQADRLETEVQTAPRGLLVLSEMYYPGWVATVNRMPVPIHKVDSLLRGVVVEPGVNEVEMTYRPRSVVFGALLSAAAFAGTILLGAVLWWRERRRAP